MTTETPKDRTFRYRSRGRTALSAGLFAFGIGMVALALVMNAPWYIFLPLGAFTAMMGYLAISDRRSGLDLDGQSLSFWSGRQRQTIPLAEIEQVHIAKWSESVDVTMHRHDGESLDLPDRCRPAREALTAALRNAGVAVTES